MTDSDGTDNPAFSNEEENHENSCTESNREDQSNKSSVDNKTSSLVGNGHSFVSQHYVEPTRNDTDPQYKTETRIEVPGDTEKNQNPTKVNGVHSNGNNDDASFLNNSAVSVQTNDGKKEQIEAVNLELVSMRPYATGNNHQKGQEACDLPNDPYEEYFVPVNEHRKYIRGEKLYVTKDKRSKSSYWRRIACWSFGLIVLAVALIIAILAATGVILTQEATQPLDNLQHTYESVKAAGSKEFILNPPSSPPPETSSFTPWPTTDETILKTVPEALNGIIWFDNLTWNDELTDTKSEVYRDIFAEIENSIRDSLFPLSTSVIKVYNITNGGKVMFRISYPPTPTPEMMQLSIEKMLQENGNRVGKWHLSRVEVKSLVDECQYENMGCTGDCKFDYSISVFTCVCPSGKTLDAAATNCIDDSDLSDVGMDVSQPKLTKVQDAVQGRGGTPDSFFVPRAHDHHNNRNHWIHQHDPHPNTHANAEPVTELQSELGATTVYRASTQPSPSTESFSEPSSEHKHSGVLASESEPSAEATLEPVVTTELESVTEPSSLLPGVETSAEPQSQVEPTSEPLADRKPTTESELHAETVIEPSEEPKSQAEPTSETIAPGTESSAAPKFMTKPASEPASEPSAEPTSEPISGVETSAEPTSESVSSRIALVAESNSVTQPASEPISHSEASAEPTSEHIPSSEPVAEAKSDEEPTIEPIPHSESSSEPTSELNPVSDPAAESKSEVKPTSEPISQSEPSAEPTSQPSSGSKAFVEPKFEAKTTVEPNSNAEPSAKFPAVPKPLLESASEPQSSPKPTLELQAPGETLEVIPLQTDFTTDIPKTDAVPPMKMSTSEKSENPIETIPVSTPEPILPDFHHYSKESIPRFSFEGNVPIEAEFEEVPMTTPSPISADAEWSTIIPEIVHPMDISTSPKSLLGSNLNITHGFPKLPENISGDVAPLNELVNVTTSTEPTTLIERHEDIHHIHEMIPELTPEHVMPQENSNVEKPMNATAIPPNLKGVAEFSTIHPLHPIILPHGISEKSTEKTILVEEKHHEDMSPFLPDVVREKEMPKKAPRLDKDEQYLPNPFEPAVVEDVIIHHENHKNGRDFRDSIDELGQSHVVQQTGTTREEDVSMVNSVTIMPTTVNDKHAVDKIIETTMSIEDLAARQIIDTNDTDISQVNVLNIRMNDEIKLNLTNTESVDVSNVSENLTIDMITTKKPHDYSNKFEENAVEDQYNDIADENVSKDLREELKTTGTVNDKIGNAKAIHQTIKPDVNIDTEMRTSDRKIDNMTTAKINTQTSPMTPEKQNEENNKFTTEIPILPIEIQQDMSTTEIVDKIRSTISIMADSDINLMMTTTQTSTIETKTTAQVPILPEEFQTTESNDIMSTTEQMTAVSNGTPTTPSITEKIPEQSTTDFIQVKSVTEKIVTTTSDTTLPNTDEMHNNEDNETTTETVTTPTANFKPVSEAIVDDPEPVTFDRSRFFTTTTKPTLVEETPEEKLRVIPIDEEDGLDDTKIMPDFTGKQMLETEIISTTPEIPSISKLKIVEITSTTGDPKTNDSIEQSSTESPKTELDATTPSRTTPEIIPVYEEVEDDSLNPFMMNLFKIITTTEMMVEKSEPESSSRAPGPILMFSKCNAGQFQCLNGTSRDGAYCVDLSSKCDSENDCSDGSDEINCQEDGCPGNFQCTSGQCLKRHLVCNGIVDCDDRSDEQMCSNWTCHFDEFKCPNGRCIPELWRCDGRPDCDDHKDEYSCSESCGNNEYLCPTENWCIPQTLRCNGVPDCANGEDEKLCDCTVDQFKCRTGGCINSDQVCDGIEHCPDRSDEWDCLADNSAMEKTQSDDREQLITLKIKMGSERFSVCSDGWNKSHSDEYCKSLGFSGSDIMLTAHNTGDQVLRLKTPSTGSNLLADLQKSDICESGEIVKVSCQEFTCGSQESEGPTARLVGGTPAGEGQWSSVALLREVKSGATCTASVLGPMHALASYSCIYKHRQSLNWELLTGRDLQQSTKVKNILPYPEVKYNQFLYDNDFALIALSQSLVFSRNVSAVCLPSQQFQPRALCVTAGWGFPINGDIDLKLNFLPIPTYDTKDCNATSHYAGFIKENHICAGFTGADKGTCYNDEGAPLMCATETGRWEIQGLLSHHSKCSRGYPAIYSSLAPIISWLHHSIPALQI